ncbi:MAG TPA: DUF1127 domain-containing protein [Oceanospirillaceae bacterium]|nr:DUF1127 domain-containing protein [Oceanospirillaceae bacterium]
MGGGHGFSSHYILRCHLINPLQTRQQQALKRTIANERQQLASLSEEMLKDIGINRAQALQEASSFSIPASRAPK